MARRERSPRRERASRGTRSTQPISVLMGWLEADSAKDARSYARGVVQQRFRAHEESWFAVLPFHGGFLWEAHEGGDGKGFIKSAAKALEEDPGGEHWFRAGDRAYRVVMQDGKPFPHLLPVDRSAEIINGGTDQLERGFGMSPYVRKGTGWLVTGTAMSASAVLFFAGSIVFYAFAYNPGPSVRATDLAALPHMKWPLVSGIGIEEIVQRLQMKNGRDWSVDRRSHKVEGLDKLRRQRADLERANRERAAIEESDRKASEAAADLVDEENLKRTIEAAKSAPGQQGSGDEPSVPAATDVPAADNAAAIPVATPVPTVIGDQVPLQAGGKP